MMKTIELESIEKDVMKILTKNSGKELSEYSIYTELSDIYNMKDPRAKDDLKLNFNVVLRSLPSIYDHIYIIPKKTSDGSEIKYACFTNDKTKIEERSNDIVHLISDVRDMPLERAVINWIVDNNIDYGLTKEDFKGNTILHYLVLYNDLERIKYIFEQKKDMSFFAKNIQKIRPIDLITDLKISNFVIDKMGEYVLDMNKKIEKYNEKMEKQIIRTNEYVFNIFFVFLFFFISLIWINFTQ
jgi:hypothetical protein